MNQILLMTVRFSVYACVSSAGLVCFLSFSHFVSVSNSFLSTCLSQPDSLHSSLLAFLPISLSFCLSTELLSACVSMSVCVCARVLNGFA